MLTEVGKEDVMVQNERKKEYDRRMKERNETNWKEKSLNGKFPQSIADFANSVTWQWLRSGYIKNSTEAIITAAQNQALVMKQIKANIDVVGCTPIWIIQSVDESSIHIASGCKQVAMLYDTTQQSPMFTWSCVGNLR